MKIFCALRSAWVELFQRSLRVRLQRAARSICKTTTTLQGRGERKAILSIDSGASFKVWISGGATVRPLYLFHIWVQDVKTFGEVHMFYVVYSHVSHIIRNHVSERRVSKMQNGR